MTPIEKCRKKWSKMLEMVTSPIDKNGNKNFYFGDEYFVIEAKRRLEKEFSPELVAQMLKEEIK